MNDDRDTRRLFEIGDPFAGEASGPPPPMPSRPRERSLTRGGVSAMRITAFVAAIAYEAIWLIVRNTRPDLTFEPLPAIALGIAIPLSGGALALAAATQPGDRGLGLSAAHVAVLALAAPAIFVVGTLLVAPTGGSDTLFWPHAARCMAATALLAVGPLGLGLWVFQRAFAAAAPWRVAAVGVACGALAAATISLHCGIGSAWHVVIGHGVAMLAAGLAGAWLGNVLSRS